MNKAGLITALADQTGQNKAEVTRTPDAFMETIGATLAQGGKLPLVGLKNGAALNIGNLVDNK